MKILITLFLLLICKISFAAEHSNNQEKIAELEHKLSMIRETYSTTHPNSIRILNQLAVIKRSDSSGRGMTESLRYMTNWNPMVLNAVDLVENRMLMIYHFNSNAWGDFPSVKNNLIRGGLYSSGFSGRWAADTGIRKCSTDFKGRPYWGYLKIKFNGDKIKAGWSQCASNKMVGSWSGTFIRFKPLPKIKVAIIPQAGDDKVSDPKIMYNIAYDYYYGKNGRIESKEEAEKWFQKAADRGHAGSIVSLVDHFWKNRDPQINAAMLHKAAEMNDVTAMHRLVEHYSMTYWGRPPDFDKAKYWTERIKETGETRNLDGAIALVHSQKKIALRKQASKREEQERKEKAALLQAKIDHEQQQKRLEKESRRAEVLSRENAATKQDAQGWRDIVSGIKIMGSDVTSSQRQAQKNTTDVFKHDQRVQKRNEVSVQRRLARQGQSTQSTGMKADRGLSGPSATRTDKPQTTLRPLITSTIDDEYAAGRGGWDCVKQWRADKCGDRHVIHTINPLVPGYTGNKQQSNNNMNTSKSDLNASDPVNSISTGDSQMSGGGDDLNNDKTKKNKQRKRINSGKIIGKSGRSNYSRASALKEAQADLEGKSSKLCNSEIYRVEISWLDNATSCDEAHGRFKCEVHANAFCYNTSCQRLYCGTARSY